MLEVKCVNKLRDKNGVIYGYTIEDAQGKHMNVQAENGADVKSKALQRSGIAAAQKSQTYDQKFLTDINDHDNSTSAPSR